MDYRTLVESFEDLKESLQKYVEANVSYYSLTAFEKVAKVLTHIYSSWIIIAVLTVAFILLSLAGGIYLGRALGSIELGILIIGGAFFLIGIILFLLRRNIFSPLVIRTLLKIFFDEKNGQLKK